MNKKMLGTENFHVARTFDSLLQTSKWSDEMISHIYMFWVGTEHSILWCLSSFRIYWLAWLQPVALQSWHTTLHQYFPSTLLLLCCYSVLVCFENILCTEKVVRQCQVWAYSKRAPDSMGRPPEGCKPLLARPQLPHNCRSKGGHNIWLLEEGSINSLRSQASEQKSCNLLLNWDFISILTLMIECICQFVTVDCCFNLRMLIAIFVVCTVKITIFRIYVGHWIF